MVISNVGSLKALVGNDMKTRLILQPNEFCKLDVIVKKADETCEIDSTEILRTLEDAGDVIHYYSFAQNSYKWGIVTYSSPKVATTAKNLIENIFDERELPYNVEKIQLKPCRVERLQPQNSVTGTNVRVTWFPFPATGVAYIKCANDCIADQLINHLVLPVQFRVRRNKNSACEVLLTVGHEENDSTVAKKVEECGVEMGAISRITVPSRRDGKDVDVGVEKQNVLKRMEEFGKVRLLSTWVANCQKLNARLVFADLATAKKAIEELHGKIGELGARAVYVELDGECEIFCNKRLHEKIKMRLQKINTENEDVDLTEENKGGRGVKIKVTGKNAEVVQKIGAKIADMVAAKAVPIDDPAVARSLSSGYGRDKLKKIEKNANAFVQSSMLGRCIQITGLPEAKEKAFKQLMKLVKELETTSNHEISLRGADIPVGAIREILKQFRNDLRALVGENNDCKPDMDIRRRKLVLQGSKDGVENARVKVETFLNELRESQPNIDKKEEECPVCFDKIEQPYRLQVCGHSYCSACISGYIASTFTAERKANMFPQKCMVDGCDYPLTKDDFIALITHDHIEQLYRVSLESFLVDSTEYKPCPSPDCSWVYKCSPSPEVFSCPECNARTCRSCGDVSHEFFDTCEAYRISKDPTKADELYEKWVSGADTRKCPSCSVMIEKNKGCAHVHCPRCDAHICWKCGKYFKTPEQCYDHQNDCTR